MCTRCGKLAKALSRHPPACLLFLFALPCSLSSRAPTGNANVDTLKTGVQVDKKPEVLSLAIFFIASTTEAPDG